MNKNFRTWVVGALAVSAVAAVGLNGCTGDSVTNVSTDPDASPVGADGSSQGGSCTPGAKECVNPSLARVCPADGSSWAAITCGTGQKCDQGDCKPDATALCTSGAGSCLSATTALRCRANLQGFEQVTCPTDTTCGGPGLCAGSCIVGSSLCLPGGGVGTCVDGKTYTATACTAGQLCVGTGATPTPTAACKAADCSPLPAGCGQVCGNKVDAAADQTMAYSVCIETPAGFKWTSVTCLTPTTCAPGSSACGGGGSQASCMSDCVPGSSRCSSDRLGAQSCGADGKWAAPITACNPTVGTTGFVCMTAPNDASKAVCGDPICASGAAGTCSGAGIRLCGNDGRLAAGATACSPGACVATGSAIGGVIPGACQAECNAGDERCSGGSSFQTCAGGRWTTPQSCPGFDGGVSCLGYTTSLGVPAKICNATCAPGETRCAAADAGPNAAIQTCGATGQWNPEATCAVGSCGAAGNGGFACLAECIPNAIVCTGSDRPVDGMGINGKDSFGACTAQGLLPTTTTACGTGTACRKGISGSAISVAGNACLECVGPNVVGGNELGTADVRCSNDVGDAGGVDGTQACAAGNTWGSAVTACPGTTKCYGGGYCSDAPECSAYTVLNNPQRNVTSGQSGGCDNGLQNKWYRFEGPAGVKMPTVVPPFTTCGTSTTGWLNGAQPLPGERNVTRQVCFHWTSGNCQWSTNIHATNCGSFIVYQLPNAPVCSGRYCGSD